MPGPARVTGPFLDVVEVFIQAFQARDDDDLHGWAIMKATGRSGPTIYGVLDRLEDMGWIVGNWQDPGPGQATPRKRMYRLTPAGEAGATELLRERRPEALSPITARRGWRPVPGQAGAT
jgi:PadR family transcriptional regulator, regulatory protein PadR